MNTKSNSKLELIELLEKLNDFEVQLLLAFAAGYEAGKQSQILSTKINHSFKN
jgi:hypothetical protein